MGAPVGDERAFAAVVGAADPAMVVVTAAAGTERSGCLVGFHSQVSIDPPQYAVWLSKANHTFGVASRGRVLGVHLLTRDDHDLAELFGGETGDEIDKLAECAWQAGPDGVPLLARCPNRFVVRHDGPIDVGGDHVCFAGAPEAVDGDDGFTPLRLADVTNVEPGHPAR